MDACSNRPVTRERGGGKVYAKESGGGRFGRNRP